MRWFSHPCGSLIDATHLHPSDCPRGTPRHLEGFSWNFVSENVEESNFIHVASNRTNTAKALHLALPPYTPAKGFSGWIKKIEAPAYIFGPCRTAEQCNVVLKAAFRIFPWDKSRNTLLILVCFETLYYNLLMYWFFWNETFNGVLSTIYKIKGI